MTDRGGLNQALHTRGTFERVRQNRLCDLGVRTAKGSRDAITSRSGGERASILVKKRGGDEIRYDCPSMTAVASVSNLFGQARGEGSRFGKGRDNSARCSPKACELRKQKK